MKEQWREFSESLNCATQFFLGFGFFTSPLQLCIIKTHIFLIVKKMKKSVF